MADEYVLRNLADGAGDFNASQFMLRDKDRPDVRFSIDERPGIYGSRNRYFLRARYNAQAERARRGDPSISMFNYTIGQLIPIDDAGKYRITYGGRVFEITITPPEIPDLEPKTSHDGPRKSSVAKITSREVEK